MKCPVCGRENPQKTLPCPHCGAVLSQITPSAPEKPRTKGGFWASIHAFLYRPVIRVDRRKRTSKLAMASFYLTFTGTPFGYFIWGLPARLAKDTDVQMLIASLLSSSTLLVAFALGIAAIVRIRRRANALQGAALAVAGIVLSCLMLVHRYALAYPSPLDVWRKDSSVAENVGRVVHTRRPLGMAQMGFQRGTCHSNLWNIGIALEIYASDHDGEFPPGPTAVQAFMELLESGLIKTAETFVCPGAWRDFKAWSRTKKLSEETCSYDYVPGLTAKSDPDFIIAYDKTPKNHWDIGRNVLCVEGYVRWMREDDFQQALAEQRAKMASATSQSGGATP